MQVLLHYYSFSSHYSLGYFTHFSEMIFRINMSSCEITTLQKSKQIKKRFWLDFYWIHLLIWKELASLQYWVFSSKDTMSVSFNQVFLLWNFVMLLWNFSADLVFTSHKVRDAMKYLYKLILERICVKMT